MSSASAFLDGDDGDDFASLFADDNDDSEDMGASGSFPVDSLSPDDVAALLRAFDSGDESDRTRTTQQQTGPEQVAMQQQVVDIATQNTRQPTQKLKKKRYPSKNPNKARDGRKEELVYLRKTVQELETKLETLRSRQLASAGSGRAGATPFTSAPGTGMIEEQQLAEWGSDSHESLSITYPQSRVDDAFDSDADASSSVWRDIALRQSDERDRSERENARLRFVLENQLKVAKSLEKFLTLKAAATTQIGKSLAPQRDSRLANSASDLSSDERDAAIFQRLLLGVEQTIAQVDAVYEANGLARTETSQISAQTRFDPEQRGMVLEICGSKVLPFGVHETGAAVWNHVISAKRRMPSRHYGYHSHKSIDATEDTVAEDITLEIQSQTTRASFRVRQVIRRVVEDERVVIVWHKFSDPVEFSEQQLSGLRSFEKGYIMIRKSRASESRPSVTLLQPCHIISPFASIDGGGVGAAGVGASDSVVGAITDFTLHTTADFVTGTQQMVENVLLEQALADSA